jgi:hypothetical protein
MTSFQKKPPKWILDSGSADINRLGDIWSAAQKGVRRQRVLRLVHRPLCSGFELPQAVPWRPPVITTVPTTPVVIDALHTGVLRKRLELSLERIYISEMALIRAPSCATKLISLAREFTARLVIVPAGFETYFSEILEIKRPLAVEYLLTGRELSHAYEEEFGWDKLWKPRVLDDVYRLRVGQPPRGIGFMFQHEQNVDARDWRDLDMEGVRQVMHQAMFVRKRQSDRAMKAMAGLFKKEDPCAS